MIVESSKGNGFSSDFKSRARGKLVTEEIKRTETNKTQTVFLMEFFLIQLIVLSLYKHFLIKLR